MKNIWQQLSKKKPFFVLAPMAGVTDSTFRQMVAGIGGPDLMFTEFVSTEMVTRLIFDSQTSDIGEFSDVGRLGLLRPQKIPPILKFSKKEKPIIAQFFGCKPEQFEKCAKLALRLGFDGIDLNMGCPDSKVLKQGSGSELMKNPKLASEIVRVVKKVVGDKIPVSAKVRLGYDKKDTETWVADILEEGVDAITIHGRTAKQGYLGEADWDEIGKITKEIKKKFPNIVVVGNGDVKSGEQACLFQQRYGVDGVMIGREVLKNPWVFNGRTSESPRISIRIGPNVKERLNLCLEHTKLFEKHYGSGVSVGAMKKYYKAYLSGLEGAATFRRELMEVKSFDEAKRILMTKRKISNIQ